MGRGEEGLCNCLFTAGRVKKGIGNNIIWFEACACMLAHCSVQSTVGVNVHGKAWFGFWQSHSGYITEEICSVFCLLSLKKLVHILLPPLLVSSHLSHASWVLESCYLFIFTLPPACSTGAQCGSEVAMLRPLRGSGHTAYHETVWPLHSFASLSLFQRPWLTSSPHWLLSRRRSCRILLRG